MLINIGPQHPATHGVLRLVLELDGETVVRCIPHIGYLHCGFEKIGEYRQYNQIIPWTDREDYLNSPGQQRRLRARRGAAVRHRDHGALQGAARDRDASCRGIISHCVWLGTFCIDIGAFTPFLWIFQQRERVYTMLESWIGARLTTTLTRVGGMGADIPDGWTRGSRELRAHLPEACSTSASTMLTKNAIWVGRTVGLGAMSAEEAVNYGLSGPMLRASRRRLRRAQGLPVPRLRDLRLRRAGRPGGRRLRSLSRAHGGDAAVDRASSSRR